MALKKEFQEAINDFLVLANEHKDNMQEAVNLLDEKDKLTEKQEERKSELEDAINAVEEAIDAVESIPE